jgi:hypothetical protein
MVGRNWAGPEGSDPAVLNGGRVANQVPLVGFEPTLDGF